MAMDLITPDLSLSHPLCDSWSLLNVLGYLIGYVSHRKPAVVPEPCAKGQAATLEEGQDEGSNVLPPPTLDWRTITDLLEKKLSPEVFSKKLRYSAIIEHCY